MGKSDRRRHTWLPAALGLMCWLAPPVRGSERVEIEHSATKGTFAFFIKEGAACCTTARSLKDIDLWNRGADTLSPASRVYGHLRLGADAKTGAIRFATADDKAIVTAWKIDRNRETSITFQLADGKYAGWYLGITEKAEQWRNADGKLVDAYPLVLVKDASVQTRFQAFDIGR